MQTILVDIAPPLATICFNVSVGQNVFNPIFAQEFATAFEQASQDPRVRVIVLRAKGALFFAGGDLKLFYANRENIQESLQELSHWVIKIADLFAKCPKPIFSAVHGAAAGIGLSFVLCSDLVLAQEKTQFSTAYVNIGLTPDGGMSYWLPRIVGVRKAAQLLMLGEVFDEKEALSLGIINWIAPAQEFNDRIDAIATRLGNGPTASYAKMREQLFSAWHNSFSQHILQELHDVAKSMETRDFQQGISAFIDKKAPQFSGD